MSLPDLTIIPAGAGAGKTYKIETELYNWIKDGKVAADRIVAVTFTETAAAELRERIRARLVNEKRIEDALKLDQSYISTIHGFGLRLITEFAFEAGVSPRPRLINEDEEAVLIGLSLAKTDKSDPIINDLTKFGYTYDFENKKSQEAVFRATILKLTGKLRSIGKLQEDPRLIPHSLKKIESIYGPTQTATHLKKLLQSAIINLLKVFPNDLSGSFPGNQAATKDLRSNFNDMKRAESGEVLDNDWKLWQRLRKLRVSNKKSVMPEDYDVLAEDVMAAADALPTHPGPLSEALVHANALLGAAQDALQIYADNKLQSGLVDYTDMLAVANQLLMQNPNVLNVLKSSVQCLVIDEFQDTNPLQFSLLWVLHKAGIPALIVGDLKQAIMGFQNTDERLLEQLEEQFPDKCEPLIENWRTTSALMKWINKVGDRLFRSNYLSLTPRATFPSTILPLEVIDWEQRPQNQYIAAQHTVCRIKALLDDKTQEIYDKRLKTKRRLRGGDIAILCRTHKRLRKYADALRELGIRTQVQQDGWFESKAVQIAYYALSYVSDTTDKHAALFLSVTEIGSSSLQDAIISMLNNSGLNDPIIPILENLAETKYDKPVDVLISEVISALDLYSIVAKWPDEAQERANLLRLQGEAREFLSANREALASGGFYGSGLKPFLAWLGNKVKKDNDQAEPRVHDENAVQLRTWHGSKGKEWPVVAVCGIDDAVKVRFPNIDVTYEDFSDLFNILDKARIDISPAFSAPETTARFKKLLQQKSENDAKRLMYVALTRAREKNILEWPSCLVKSTSKQISYWGVLQSFANITIEDNKMHVDGTPFDCIVTKASKVSPPEFDQMLGKSVSVLTPFGRNAIQKDQYPDQLTPEHITPSSLHAEIPEKISGIVIYSYSNPFDLDLGVKGADRGLLLHRCFEIVSGNQQYQDYLKIALDYEITAEQQKEICKLINEFDDWVEEQFSPVNVGRELPVLAQDENNSVIVGTLDMLVETADGYWIVDHKSDITDNYEERFTVYLPQLESYAKAVKHAKPDSKNLGMAINWISQGSVMTLPMVE